jgi:hypothetical protein
MQDTATSLASRFPAIGRHALAIACACAAVLMVASCTRAEDKPLPTDPKARGEFIDAQRVKLTEQSQSLLNRFLARLKTQEAAGGAAPTVSISKALDLQRAYDTELAEVQRQYHDGVAAAKADVRVDVREQSVVKVDVAKSPAGKALRYTLDVTNTGKRIIDRVALRIEIREEAGTYLAAIPLLELKGPLKPGEAGRTIQIMPLNPGYQAYLIAGHRAQIIGVPVKIMYADGMTIDADAELNKLQQLSRRKIE